MFHGNNSETDDEVKISSRDRIHVVGPAGLNRGDLMYKWEVCETIKSRANGSVRCCLCHSEIRKKQRIRRYKEGHKLYVVHEGCFYTYLDIIHPEKELPEKVVA